jgi:hypothetical protein
MCLVQTNVVRGGVTQHGSDDELLLMSGNAAHISVRITIDVGRTCKTSAFW